MLDVLLSSAPYLVTIITIKLFIHFGFLSVSIKPAVSDLVGKIALPLIIFATLIKINLKPSDGKLFLLCLILVFGLQALIFFIAKLRDIKTSKQMAMVLGFGSLSLGTIIYPLAMLNFGNDVFQKVVLYDSIGWFIIFLTFSQFFAQIKSNEAHSLYESLAKIAKSPSVIAIVLGLTFNLINFTPQILIDSVEFSSRSFGFLAALLVALNLTMPKPKTVTFIFVAFIARIAIGLSIIIILNAVIHFDEPTIIAITLSMFSPVSVMGLIFCDQYGFDEKYYTQILAVTTIASLIFLPFVIAALKLLV